MTDVLSEIRAALEKAIFIEEQLLQTLSASQMHHHFGKADYKKALARLEELGKERDNLAEIIAMAVIHGDDNTRETIQGCTDMVMKPTPPEAK